jgi:F-type H+-transporting ATPase subunit alpha
MLRLDLAQYKELAAFAQFSSDLDKATLAQIARGQRMVELLKQDQYVPMPVEDQVLLIFAGTNGFLDDIPVPSIRKFEKDFVKYLRDKKEDLRKELREKRVIDDDLRAKIGNAIEEFKKTFEA